MTATVRCISPIDGSLVVERPVLTSAELEIAVQRARRAQHSWQQASLAERGQACTALVAAVLAMQDGLVPELARQMGRPVQFGAGELRGFDERASYMIGIAEAALAPLVPAPLPGFKRWVQRDPVGLVLVIAPWNFPWLTAVNSIVPALMAGNAVLLKHAAQTLLVGERLAQAAAKAGLPDGLLQALVLDHRSSNRLLADGVLDQVNFTGSVNAGRTIEQALAGTFTGLGLELGGKDPAYVAADANVEQAAVNLADGAFFNSGQSCCGIERIYVHKDHHEELVERLADLALNQVLGSPLDPNTTLGPMAQASGARAVREQVAAAAAQGARLLVDPRLFPDDGGQYLAPQVLSHVDHGMAVMTEETFGPVVGVMPVASDEEAVALMNDSAYGLTASIWTGDVGRAEHLGQQLQTGTVFMNRCDYLDPALAWTGVKDTGRGVTLSAWGYQQLTRVKSFHLKLPAAI